MITPLFSSRQQIISRLSFFVVAISLKQDSRLFITLWQVCVVFDKPVLMQTLLCDSHGTNQANRSRIEFV